MIGALALALMFGCAEPAQPRRPDTAGAAEQ